MFSTKALVLALVALPFTQAYWILNHSPLVRTRLDPIVSPGNVASHEHNILGGSMFQSTYSQAVSLSSSCTTAEVSVDKSNYWAPQLYYYEPIKKTYQAIGSSSKTYYLQRPGSKNEKIHAFPDGLRMLAGNPNRRVYNSANFAEQAISFVCLDYYNSHSGDPAWEQTSAGFFKQNCPDGLRTQLFFPSCWDGVNLDSDNHQSHMAYPVDSYQGGNCPSTHPVHLISLFYEFIWNVGDFPFNAAGTPTWVFANGDTTGLGFHADFTNGWPLGADTNILQQAIDTCGDETGGVVDSCAVFVPYIDRASAAACQPQGAIVNEANGWGAPISALPGDNPLWIGNVSKPTSGSSTNPGFTQVSSTLPDGWSTQGCIAEGTSGRAMVGGYVSSSSNMTLGICATFCENLGLPYAGVEYGQECYCDSVMRNGASTTLISDDRCAIKCTGLSTENCGGSSTLTLIYNPDNVAAPVSLPTGWSVPSTGSCRTEATSGRALALASTSGSTMTVETCVNYCNGKGYSIAGVEYGSECYCGNTFASGSIAASTSDCNMPCAGNLGQTCGGSSRLNIYQKSGSASTTSITTKSSSTSTQASTTSSKTSTKATSTTTSTSPAAVATIVSSGTTYKSLGCYVDSGTAILTGSMTSTSTNTPSTCVASCLAAGFSYAGVEYGNQCFCGNTLGGYSTGSDDCSMSCVGDSSKICGGFYRMNVYQKVASTGTTTTTTTSSVVVAATTSSTKAATTTTVPASVASSVSLSNGWSSTGSCINDPSGSRLMGGTPALEQGGMTYEICTNYCASQGYSQAGLEYSTQCFCSSSVSISSTTSSTGCTMTCGGNSNVKCGGSYAMIVFTAPAVTSTAKASTVISTTTKTSTSTTQTSTAATAATASSTTLSNGWSTTGACSSDSPRLMTVMTNINAMTPLLCTNYCSNLGYTQAGLEYGNQCYCSSSVNTASLTTSNSCTSSCAGDSSKICGGSYAMNVYTAPNYGVSAPSGWTYLHCVSDGASARALAGYLVSTSSMTLSSCASTCTSKGYSMFGVEYNSQCLCGNTLASTSSQIAESSCSYTCTGSSEICGGFSAMSLFTTKPSARKRGGSGVWSSSRVQ